MLFAIGERIILYRLLIDLLIGLEIMQIKLLCSIILYDACGKFHN